MKVSECANCGGTGKIVVARSWFPDDGYRRERCGICGGSGASNYKPDAYYVRWQAARRAALGEKD